MPRVAVLALALAAMVQPTVQQAAIPVPTVCVCSCCYLGNCVTIRNGTYRVSDCDSCTNQQCERNYQGICQANRFLYGHCFQRDATLPKVTCFLLLGLIGSLIVVGVLKNNPVCASWNFVQVLNSNWGPVE
eukprot:TRINITY_DN40548_c0_g1_i1.p2 TRINITY_DN40548_c0_g1~~TRINITY_DN40548_c0_g1_i1.p2  ORF type:complete len:131 (+),score=20.57 TRINITY_DN40548_c0_g1_i1:94-486(+)